MEHGQKGHTRGLWRYYTQAKIDLDRQEGKAWQENRLVLEPQLSATLRAKPHDAATIAQHTSSVRESDLPDEDLPIAALVRVSISSRALRLAHLLDETGYAPDGLPQDRWAALVTCAALLVAHPDWPIDDEQTGS